MGAATGNSITYTTPILAQEFCKLGGIIHPGYQVALVIILVHAVEMAKVKKRANVDLETELLKDAVDDHVDAFESVWHVVLRIRSRVCVRVAAVKTQLTTYFKYQQGSESRSGLSNLLS